MINEIIAPFHVQSLAKYLRRYHGHTVMQVTETLSYAKDIDIVSVILSGGGKPDMRGFFIQLDQPVFVHGGVYRHMCLPERFRFVRLSEGWNLNGEKVDVKGLLPSIIKVKPRRYLDNSYSGYRRGAAPQGFVTVRAPNIAHRLADLAPYHAGIRVNLLSETGIGVLYVKRKQLSREEYDAARIPKTCHVHRYSLRRIRRL